MLEQGIVILVNTSLSSPPFDGGYLGELPKNHPLPSWYYISISDIPDTTLTTAQGLSMRRLEINAIGGGGATQTNLGSDAINLAARIDAILHGFAGTLPDLDLTVVSSCFRSDIKDFFDPAARTNRRLLEYEILYSPAA
jgi:hypothetical protein